MIQTLVSIKKSSVPQRTSTHIFSIVFKFPQVGQGWVIGISQYWKLESTTLHSVHLNYLSFSPQRFLLISFILFLFIQTFIRLNFKTKKEEISFNASVMYETPFCGPYF